ncbi:hypothetical protein [Hymenobacter lapidarius]|uniref:hypothetical protein n=1 Tax=Hymenobacter lapidarius TaxID=1908237 RepID=UPI0009F6AD5C|nr:hypothetical protein [Hymenobacter lapidarius]
MRVTNILSTRAYELSPPFHLIYEWEDDLAAALGVPVADAKMPLRKALINRYTKPVYNKLSRGLLDQLNNRLEHGRPAVQAADAYSLAYELYPAREPNFTTAAKTIPLLIDLWKPATPAGAQDFGRTYHRCPLVLISSLEALQYMQEHNCPLNLAHLALSLSDRYRLLPETHYEKKYDILLAGRLNIRTNQVLRDYLDEYVRQHPTTEYLYQEEIDGEYYYASNQTGLVGKFQSREDYIGLLRASKISFYSTPGIDGGEIRTGGFNPVTPRYLELLAAQCLLLGKYPDNAETRYYELPKVCPNVSSYEEFARTLSGYLHEPAPSFDTHRAILNKHYTSVRAKELLEILAAQ